MNGTIEKIPIVSTRVIIKDKKNKHISFFLSLAVRIIDILFKEVIRLTNILF